ncbi:hypothetical protein PC110_g13482 [Phytophthora cactorum]|uniref:Uncharacterized protein n=1 Tax=Phytophthora cactorum TaxID=29920 RepID=A0A329RZW9_9STRA|nr:hypothetical protein PC110_g13482 [Phytophthora cactorum]
MAEFNAWHYVATLVAALPLRECGCDGFDGASSGDFALLG